MKTNKEHKPYLDHIEYRCALVADSVNGKKDLSIYGLPLATPEQIHRTFSQESESFLELSRDHSNGVRTRCCYDNRSDLLILGFGGTEPINMSDWQTNIQQFAGYKAEHYERGIQFVQCVRSHMRERVILTGHSLGGGVASLAALTQKIPAIVFNPPSIHRNTLERFGEQDFALAMKKIKRFVVAGEILDIINKLTDVTQNKRRRVGMKHQIYGSFSIHKQIFVGLVGRKLLVRLVPNPFVSLLTNIGLPLLEKSLELHLMPEVFIGLRKYIRYTKTTE